MGAIRPTAVALSTFNTTPTRSCPIAQPQDDTCDIGAVEMVEMVEMEVATAVYSLTVALAGEGSGVVSSEPEGIACTVLFAES